MSGYGWTEEDLKRHMQQFQKPLDCVGVTGNVGKFDARDALSPPMEPKPSKYRNRKTTVDGITFDSGHEAKCWTELKMREKAGEIEWLVRQVPYAIVIDGIRVCDYLADFVWREAGSKADVVADAKGHKTAMYRLKRKLMQAVNKIEVVEL